jgi:ABC-2 type transport system ATP-binding protein
MTLAVDARALTKVYTIAGRFFNRRAQKKVVAISDVNLQIKAGEIFGVVGRNGYGKTTLIKCLSSLLIPTCGQVHVFSLDASVDSRAVRQLIGWVGTEERSFYFRLTGRQNLAFFARLQGLEPELTNRRITELAETFDLAQLLDRRFFEYSTGNRQRLALARGLLHNPKLLILDEPTRSLDPFAADTLRKCLSDWVSQGEQRTIIITSHNLDEIEALSHRVAIMSRGRLKACGSVEELRSTWGESETVGLLLASMPEQDILPSELRPHIFWEKTATQEVWLRLRHVVGDDALSQTLSGLSRAGIAPLSVERSVLRLQDIIDRVDETDEGQTGAT